MILLLKIIREGLRMASAQLWSNKLRTFLSLLGISIGIFCIISVLAAVDSLERNILNGFSEFGSDVVYVDKQPWTEDPGDNWWKYLKRPEPHLRDYDAIKRKSNLAEYAAYCYFTVGSTIKRESSSIEGAIIMGSTPEYVDIQDITLIEGRFFSTYEYQSASDVVIIGHTIKEEIFGEVSAVGRDIKMLGRKFKVIGVIEEEGENIFNFLQFDDIAWMSLNTMKKFYNVGKPYGNVSGGQLLAVQAKEGIELDALKDELTGILRGNRKLRPFEDINFALNEVSMLGDAIAPVIGAMNFAGFLIGIFSLIVGMISVANIMFVSVKERTGLIGVKKALGARQFFILMEFLLESIFLCIIGGVMGLMFVFGLLKLVSALFPFEMWLSPLNIIIGVGVSITVGIIAGMVPAWLASRLDPVVAMRG